MLEQSTMRETPGCVITTETDSINQSFQFEMVSPGLAVENKIYNACCNMDDHDDGGDECTVVSSASRSREHCRRKRNKN